MVVDKHDLSPRCQILQKSCDNQVFIIFRNFVEQEKADNRVVLKTLQVCQIILADIHMIMLLQLLAAVFYLNRRDIDNIQMAVGANEISQPDCQVAINI